MWIRDEFENRVSFTLFWYKIYTKIMLCINIHQAFSKISIIQARCDNECHYIHDNKFFNNNMRLIYTRLKVKIHYLSCHVLIKNLILSITQKKNKIEENSLLSNWKKHKRQNSLFCMWRTCVFQLIWLLWLLKLIVTTLSFLKG